MHLLQTAKSFLLAPAAGFEAIRAAPLREAAGYLLRLLVLQAALAGAVTALLAGADAAAAAVAEFFFVGAVVAGLTPCWLHVWARLLGARGFGETVRAVWYGATPAYLLGWLAALPEAGKYARMAVILWSFALYAVGLRQLHHLSSRRAAAAAALALLVGLALIVGFAVFTFRTFLPFIAALART